MPVGTKQSHPDFVVLHPRRGLLIPETEDWKLETIQQATWQACDILVDGRIKVVMNPLAQARFCAIQIVNACSYHSEIDASAVVPARKHLLDRALDGSGQFNPLQDTIKVMILHASKGFE